MLTCLRPKREYAIVCSSWLGLSLAEHSNESQIVPGITAVVTDVSHVTAVDVTSTDPVRSADLPPVYAERLANTRVPCIFDSQVLQHAEHEDYVNDKRRRSRTNFSGHQLAELELIFRVSHYPSMNVREELAERLKLPESRIQVCLTVITLSIN